MEYNSSELAVRTVVIAELGDIIKKQTGECQFMIWGDYWFKSVKAFFKGLFKKLYCLRSLGRVCVWERESVRACVFPQGRKWVVGRALSVSVTGWWDVCVNCGYFGSQSEKRTGDCSRGFLGTDVAFWFPDSSASWLQARPPWVGPSSPSLPSPSIPGAPVMGSCHQLRLGSNTRSLTSQVTLDTSLNFIKPRFDVPVLLPIWTGGTSTSFVELL